MTRIIIFIALCCLSSCAKTTFTCTGYDVNQNEQTLYGLTEEETKVFEETHDPKSCIEEVN